MQKPSLRHTMAEIADFGSHVIIIFINVYRRKKKRMHNVILFRTCKVGVVLYGVVLMSHVRMITYNKLCRYTQFTRKNCDISLHMNVYL